MEIKATKREITGKKVKNLRKEGLVPAAVYGPSRESTNIQLFKSDLIRVFKELGYSKFVDLDIAGESKVKALIKEIQIHPVSYEVKGASFYQVDEKRKITVEVPLKMIGEAPAVKQNLGFLIDQLDTIALHCFPKDLPSELVVDVSNLNNPGDAVTVGSVKLPENVELDSSMDPTTAIAYIGTAQKEEEVKAVVAETTETPATGDAGKAAPAKAAPAADAKKAGDKK